MAENQLFCNCNKEIGIKESGSRLLHLVRGAYCLPYHLYILKNKIEALNWLELN